MTLSKPIILGLILSSISLPTFAVNNIDEEDKNQKEKVRFVQGLEEENHSSSVERRATFFESFLKSLFGEKSLRSVIPAESSKKTEVISWSEAKQSLPFENIFTSKNTPPSDASASLESSIKGISYQFNEPSLSLAQDSIPNNSFKVAKLLPSTFQESLPSLLMSSEMVQGEQNKDVIGALALNGPVFRYLKYTPKKNFPNTYTIDFSQYECFSVKDGLAKLGGIATLHYNAEKAIMETESILYNGRVYTSSSEEWQHKQKIFLATISTDVTLIRQLLYNHLLIGGTFSAITNHYLAPDHPVRILLHSYQAKILLLNNKVLPKLFKDKKSALYNTLSYDQESLTRLLQEKTADFYINYMDPYEELREKNMSEILGKPGQMPYPPFLKRKMQVWDLISNHVKEYIDIYYSSNSLLNCDNQIANWYRILGQCIPNGISYYAYDLSKPNLQALITLFIYTTAVERQDLLDNFQLNNGIWHNLIPTQVPANPSSRSTIGILHQYLKLLSKITPSYPTISDDFSSFALDRVAQNKMVKFQHQVLMLK